MSIRAYVRDFIGYEVLEASVTRCVGCREILTDWNTWDIEGKLCKDCEKENPGRCKFCINEEEPCWECKLDDFDEGDAA